MTRKRFIKLLMAKWYDRNEANEIAKVLVCGYEVDNRLTFSYKAVYEASMRLCKEVQ